MIDTTETTTSALVASGGKMLSPKAKLARMNENSPICASATAIESAERRGRRKSKTTTIAAKGFPIMTMPSVARIKGQPSATFVWIKEHSYRNKEQDGKGISHRESLRRAARAKLRLAHDHPGKKRTQRHRCTEQLCRAHRDTQREHKDRQRKEVTRAGPRDVTQQPWNNPLPGD